MPAEHTFLYNQLRAGLSMDQQARIVGSSYDFLMACNGNIRGGRGDYTVQPQRIEPLVQEHNSTNVVLFGPNDSNSFFSSRGAKIEHYEAAFRKPIVTEVISTIKRQDPDQAARVAFIFGGLVRQFTGKKQPHEIANMLEFEARMTSLGEGKSYDAIAAVAANHLISSGATKGSELLKDDTLAMSDAISNDPVVPYRTMDLGLSQTMRLRDFWNNSDELYAHPEVEEHLESVKDLPTVGAEFHLPISAQTNHLWERLAILNMSQFQRGSYVQFSRNDRGVLEIRMNPSVAPITAANYNLISLVVPEIRNAYFTTTLNRDGENFVWDQKNTDLLQNLHALGMLGYASFFEDVKPSKKEEIPLGEVYLGQTVKFEDGKGVFTGGWYGDRGNNGQVGIYTGYGNTLPFFSYYLSMVLAKPEMLDDVGDLSSIKTLEDALTVPAEDRKWVFDKISESIMQDPKLRRAHDSSVKLVDVLRP